MYQTIVLSPTIIKFLEENPVRSEALALLQLIQLDKLVTDTGGVLEKEFFNLIDHSPKAEVLKSLWGEIFFTLRFYKANVLLAPRQLSEFDALASETLLAQATPWQIIVAAMVPKELRSQLFRKYGIEACDVTGYLKPQAHSQIRGSEHYHLQPGEQFNFREWLMKYLGDAKKVEIADRYIFKNTIAKNDLEYILKNLKDNTTVLVVTLEGEGESTQTNLKQLENDFPNLKIQWKLKNTHDLHDRWVETDKFRIDLGHGLGFVNPKTSKVLWQANISVRGK